MKIMILGSEWSIAFKKIKDYSGYTDISTKEIFIQSKDSEAIEVENFDRVQRRVIRHELIHAFLYESGLGFNSEWAINEEMVDWFAIQFPKINKVIAEIPLFLEELEKEKE